ncbi:MAG: hypothetical protein Q9227_006348 [Pyrenula ochraceoflavens]
MAAPYEKLNGQVFLRQSDSSAKDMYDVVNFIVESLAKRPHYVPGHNVGELTDRPAVSFIEENHEHKLSEKFEQNARKPVPGAVPQPMMSYWGYKFETLSVIPQIWDATSRSYIEKREDEIVNNHAQYCSVARTGYGKVKMIIGGEVDAVWDKRPTDKTLPIHWVELKTAAEIQNDRDVLKFERKLMKYWIQSFLLGVPTIIVGFRTPEGILIRVEELETQAIPERVQSQGKRSWDGNTCINFAANFLEWLKSVITGDGVWRIRKRERTPKIEVFKLEDTGYGDILSDDFIKWRSSLNLPDAQIHNGS